MHPIKNASVSTMVCFINCFSLAAHWPFQYSLCSFEVPYCTVQICSESGVMLLILVYMLMTSDSIVAELIDPGDYIDTVLAYYRHRNARIITHFTCFPTRK